METQQPVARIVVGPASAPALVLLHGITGSAVSQSEAISHWARAGYRVIALDARGHGLSPRWSPEQLARAGEVLVDDVVAALSEIEAERSARLAAALPAPAVPPVLIGHSMGGATAMVVAARHPELVAVRCCATLPAMASAVQPSCWHDGRRGVVRWRASWPTCRRP